MDLGIKGRVAVVTGGDSGMGYATAEVLLREGARVVLSDLPGRPLDEAGAKLGALGEAVAVPADLARPDGAERLRAETERRFGPAHILVHAAGITGPTGDFLSLSDEDWRQALESDLMAAVRVCRAFIPAMREARWGRVVLFCSEDAVQPYPDELPYCAAKAAVLNLSKGLSKAYGADGVLVNAVSPAFVATPMTDAMMEKRAEEKGTGFDEAVRSFLDEERPGIALKRRGRAEEVGAMVAMLCSERASFVTGANLRVDGGSVFTMGT